MTSPTYFDDADATRGHGEDLSSIGDRLKSKLEGHRTDLEALYSDNPEGNDDPGRSLKKSHSTPALEFLKDAPEVGTAISGVGGAVVKTVDLAVGVDNQGAAKVKGAVDT
ncbi:MAG: hypothetical protein ACRDT8_08480 [Micromonosporaceae bacterium]